jgi:hypothetical protein
MQELSKYCRPATLDNYTALLAQSSSNNAAAARQAGEPIIFTEFLLKLKAASV